MPRPRMRKVGSRGTATGRCTGKTWRCRKKTLWNRRQGIEGRSQGSRFPATTFWRVMQAGRGERPACVRSRTREIPAAPNSRKLSADFDPEKERIGRMAGGWNRHYDDGSDERSDDLTTRLEDYMIETGEVTVLRRTESRKRSKTPRFSDPRSAY